jgi:PAS domain S-box-containing protein
MGRRSQPLLRVQGEAPDAALLAALGDGAAEPQVVFEVLDGGDLAVAWVNQAMRESGLLLHTHQVGATPADALVPECAVSLREGYAESLGVGERYAYEQFVVIEGVETWWMTTLSPLFDAEGRPRWVVATFLQLDFVRRTEAALRRTEANFRELIERAPDAAVVCRADGAPVYANPSAIALFGREIDPSASGLDGDVRTVFEHVPEAFRDGLRQQVAAALDGGEADAVPFELQIAREPNETIVLELRAIRLVFDGEPGVLLSARDVSELRRGQASLAVADRMIALGRMAAGVAHEINNPLAYVHANLQFSIDEIERLSTSTSPIAAAALAEPLAALREAIEGAGRVRDIVQDLRSLSRLDPGPQRPVSVVTAVEAALKLAGTELRSRGMLDIQFDSAPLVTAHEPRLVQVFLNLLLNAAHAIGGAEGREARVAVATGRDASGRAFVEISDTGVGIRDSDMPRIFDPFFTTRAPGEGLGLGLSVCHQIISAIGGRIEVESRFGHGTTFRVLIPAAGSELPTEPND